MDTWEKIRNVSIIAGVVAVIAFIGYQAWNINRLRDEVLVLQTQQARATLAEIQHVLSAHRDSVVYVERRIIEHAWQKTKDSTLVAHTGDADSLVDLYWKHRANIGP